jgi:PAS domain-containing protein
MHMQLAFGSVVVVTCVASALLALGMFSFGTSACGASQAIGQMLGSDQRVIFLFKDRALVDATPSAMALLDASPGHGKEWDRLAALLTGHFADFDEQMARLAERGHLDLKAPYPSGLRLIAEDLGRVARIEISDTSGEPESDSMNAIGRHAQEDELAELRETAAALPVLAWRLDRSGRMSWANRAYMTAAASFLGVTERGLVWPLPILIEPDTGIPNGDVRRAPIASGHAQHPSWFECRSYTSDRGSLHFAVPSDTAVKAETALRDFVQTLTKTFAHLPIGLAIFDRQRQLALFNPALVDLTQLGAEFLTARPTLFTFLDRLREARMIPEPKDYPTWRRTMADLEKRAASGLYEETWTLSTGQTYRVIGRPHPDGAVAFLLEDISAETSLNRRFRADIELGQNVLDAMDEAVAVFSPAGILILSNQAYERLWGSDPGSTLGEVGIDQAIRHWQSLTEADGVWTDLRDFVTDITLPPNRTAVFAMGDGRVLMCRFQRLTGGVSLIGFRAEPPDRIEARRPRRVRIKAAAAVSATI